jgi:ABC-2 type transport system ATP-binding protein
MRATGLELSENLRKDLEEVIRKHGGSVDSMGHPTTTLEDYFLKIVEESSRRPGRRYLPESSGQAGR